MNRKKAISLVVLLFSVLVLSSCSGSHTASAQKLITAFYSSAGSGDVTVLEAKDYSSGYLALAQYTGAGGHLELFRMENGKGGDDKIKDICEGGKAGDVGYSVNIVQDSANTIVFVEIANPALQCSHAEFTFSNGEKVTANGSGKGFIAMTSGKQGLTDFVLSDMQKGKPNTLAAYRDAGGSVTQTGFIPVG